jgi:hypothetical protein
VRIEVSGDITASRNMTLQPNCTPEESRRQDNRCRSIDVYFTPPSGSWSVTVNLFDQSGNELQSHDLSLTSVDADPIRLAAVRVCDAKDASGKWLCEDNYYNRLQQLVPLLRKIAPTDDVTVEDSGETVRRLIDANGDGKVTTTGRGNESVVWWGRTVNDIERLHGFFDWLNDLFGLEERRYYGIIRQAINDPSGRIGRASGIPGEGAMSLTIASDRGQDVSEDTVAHEVFHTLGRRHTNTDNPNTSCSLAPDPGTDWPHADNGIQEVGFDVATRRVVPGTRACLQS